MRRWASSGACLGVMAAFVPAQAWAHGDHGGFGDPPGWTLSPWIVVPIFASAAIFAAGWLRLSARSSGGTAALRKRAGYFMAGWLALAGALISPLHEAGERSFAAHMFEHEVLMLVAAPLLVLAEPLAVMLWALPARGRAAAARASLAPAVRRAWAFATGTITATLLQAAALWLWHVPPLFDRALASEGWHIAQHMSFIVSALLFWTATIGRQGMRGPRERRALAALCLFATSIVSGALGALMAFAQSPWYRGYVQLGIDRFGLSPLEDQQLAGLLMWVPGGLVHALAALGVVRALLAGREDRRAHAL